MSDSFSFDLFLSHCSGDAPYARQLAERLRSAGRRVWFDEWNIENRKDERKLSEVNEKGLNESRVLVMCLSPRALASEWVQLERMTTRFRYPSNTNRRFIPLLLSDCKLPEGLRRYKHIDFRKGSDAAF